MIVDSSDFGFLVCKAERRVHNTAEIVADLRPLQRHTPTLQFGK